VVRTSCGGITAGHDKLLERATDDRLDARCLEALHILQQGMHNIAQQVVRRELEEFSANKQVPRPIQKEAEKVTGYLCMDNMRISAKRAPFVTKKGHPGLSS
jgi:hypothetical protein